MFLTKRYFLFLATITLVLGMSAFAFWLLAYNGHLHFYEQCQMLELTWRRFADMAHSPEFLAQWLGQFFTQFFYSATLGATVVALLLVLVQLLSASCMSSLSLPCLFLPLSLVLPVSIGYFLLHFEAMMSHVVAYVFLMAFLLVYYRWGSRSRYAVPYVMISVVLLYWLVGPVALLFVVGSVAYDLFVARRLSLVSLLVYALQAVVALLQPIVWQYLSMYSLADLFCGLTYYRQPGYFDVGQQVVMCSFFLWLSLVFAFRRRHLSPVAARVVMSLLLVVACSSMASVYLLRDAGKERIMRFDYWARFAKWDKIISECHSQAPTNNIEYACLYHALARKGVLSKAYSSLMPPNASVLLSETKLNYVEPLHMGDIWLDLGFVNTAQRFAVEAQNALYDRGESVRCCQRIVETNLVNGNTKVAQKFLAKLHNTLHYRDWQPSPDVLDRCRRLYPDTTYLHVENNIEHRLALQFRSHPDDVIVRDYYLCYLLTERNAQAFVEAFDIAFRDASDVPQLYLSAYQSAIKEL